MSLMSEISQFQSKETMGLDTVRIKSPYMARQIVDKIKAQGESYNRVCNETGDIVWEMTRTNLRGSFDSRIMVKPMYEDCIKSQRGKPEWHPSHAIFDR